MPQEFSKPKEILMFSREQKQVTKRRANIVSTSYIHDTRNIQPRKAMKLYFQIANNVKLEARILNK